MATGLPGLILLGLIFATWTRISAGMHGTLSMGRSSAISMDADEMAREDSSGSFELSHLEKKAAILHQQIRKRLNTVVDGEEVFRIAEDIPAINRCIDKAVSIASADKEDADDAVLAIQRLASLSVEHNNWALTSNDRRFEQLSDCVEIGLSEISCMDLCKYMWSISVLGLSDEQRARAVFKEYMTRLEPTTSKKALTEGEMATMMWTVGCVRNNFGWTDDNLMANLTTSLLDESMDTLNKSGRLLVRILWTLTVHKDSVDSADGKRLGQKVLRMLDLGYRHEHLSPHHISTIILATASLHLMEDEDAEELVEHVAKALSTLKLRIVEETISISELDLAASALTELHNELQFMLQRWKVSFASKISGAPSSAHMDTLLSQTRSTAESLLTIGLNKMSQLDVESCASLMRIVVTVLPRGILSSEFIEAAAARLEVFVESWHAQHYFWSPTDAASLLESVAQMTWNMRGEGPSEGGTTSSIGVHGKDRLDVELMQAKLLRDRRSASSDSSDHDSVEGGDAPVLSPIDRKWSKFTPFQRWQRLAGICSSVCSSQADNINDVPLLVGSAWSCVSYCRPCRSLAREVKLRLASSDFEKRWDPVLLSRVASVMVSVHGGKGGLTATGKLRSGGGGGEEDFVMGFDVADAGKLARKLLPTVQLIPSLSERINALIAIANLNSNSPEGVGGTLDKRQIDSASIDFDPVKLQDVRSRVLLRFLQADVPKNEDMDIATKKALRKRKVDPTTVYAYGEPSEQTTRLTLLAELMRDWNDGRGNDRLLSAPLIDSIKEALRDMLPASRLMEIEARGDSTEDPPKPSPLGVEAEAREIYYPLADTDSTTTEEIRSEETEFSEEWSGADLVALGDALQVVAAHCWKDDELEALVDAVIGAVIEQCDENNNSSSGQRHLYDIGRIEGMLQLYRLAKQHPDRSPKDFFGFASGVARKFIPKIRNAFVHVLTDRGD